MTDLIVEVIPDPKDVTFALPERRVRSLPAPARKRAARRQKTKARR